MHTTYTPPENCVVYLGDSLASKSVFVVAVLLLKIDSNPIASMRGVFYELMWAAAAATKKNGT